MYSKKGKEDEEEEETKRDNVEELKNPDPSIEKCKSPLQGE